MFACRYICILSVDASWPPKQPSVHQMSRTLHIQGRSANSANANRLDEIMLQTIVKAPLVTLKVERPDYGNTLKVTPDTSRVFNEIHSTDEQAL